MFALVADDQLFLKVDESTKAMFDAEHLPAFQYEKQGKRYSMSYHLAPERIFDDVDEAKQWAEYAFQVAVVAIKPRKRAKKGLGKLPTP